MRTTVIVFITMVFGAQVNAVLAGPEDQQLRTAYEAFASGDYETAMYDYERLLRSANPRVQIRALISLAMIRLLPSSKMQDQEAAEMVLTELDRRIKRHDLEHEFFGEVELLRLLGNQQQLRADVNADVRRLRKEVQKRDEVIRQLRALTLEDSYEDSPAPGTVDPSSQTADPADPIVTPMPATPTD